MSNVLLTAASSSLGAELVPLLTSSPSIKKLVLPTDDAEILAPRSTSTKIIVTEGSTQSPTWIKHQLEEHDIDTVFLDAAGGDEVFMTAKPDYTDGDVSGLWSKALGRSIQVRRIGEGGVRELEDRFEKGSGVRSMYEDFGGTMFVGKGFSSSVEE